LSDRFKKKIRYNINVVALYNSAIKLSLISFSILITMQEILLDGRGNQIQVKIIELSTGIGLCKLTRQSMILNKMFI
jgi:hypothetical protein